MGEKEFARRFMQATREIHKEHREKGIPAGPYYHLREVALRMEGKKRYGPWYRKWAERVEKLEGHSIDGLAIFFATASRSSYWNIRTNLCKRVVAFVYFWDNDKYRLPEVDETSCECGRL